MKKQYFNVIDIAGWVFTLSGVVCLATLVFFITNYDSFVHEINGEPIGFLIMFALFGLIFIAIGAAILVHCMKRNALNRRAYENGFYLTLPISDIRMDTTIRVNCSYMYVVEAQYTSDDGEVHLFRSRPFMYNPKSRLRSDTVNVYIIPPDYDHYYMDVDSILGGNNGK